MMSEATFERIVKYAEERPPCPECGKIYRDQTLRNGDIRPLRVMCSHEEAADKARQEAERLESMRRDRIETARRIYTNARPPLIYRDTTLDSLDFRACSKEGVKVARRYLATWAERRKEGQGLILSGDIGTGKTMVAAAIANEVVNLGSSALFLSVSELQNRLRDFDNAQSTLDRLKGVDLLVLDDFGQEKASEWAASQLFDLVDDRCQNKRPLILTTNLGSDGLEAHYVRCLVNGKDRMSQDEAEVTVGRILSRLRQRCAAVQFVGEDQRANPDHSWLEG